MKHEKFTGFKKLLGVENKIGKSALKQIKFRFPYPSREGKKEEATFEILRVRKHLFGQTIFFHSLAYFVETKQQNMERKKNSGNKISIRILTTLTSTPGIFLWKSPFPLLHLHKWMNEHQMDMMVMRSRQGEGKQSASALTASEIHFFSIIDPTFFPTSFRWGWKK